MWLLLRHRKVLQLLSLFLGFIVLVPPLEDFLEDDLGEVPQLFDETQRQELAEFVIEDTGARIRAPIVVEGLEYKGTSVSRKGVFSDSSLSGDAESMDSMSLQEETPSQASDLYETYNQLNDDIGLSELRKGAEKDRKRGLAVKRDLQKWSQCLELRVMLQKSLTESHRLPSSSFFTHLTQSSSLLSLRQHLVDSAKVSIGKLMKLEGLRLAGRKRKEMESGKNGFKNLWSEMEEQYSALSEFRDETLDRYHRQAMLQSGASTNKGHLQILHQGISTQVNAMMQFPRKMLLKTKMSVSDQPKIIGGHQDNLHVGAELNEEIYDDQDFYQNLLSEYLTNQVAKHGSKKVMRRKSRRSESKKRLKALFTDAQEKLVNFMTPVEMPEPDFAKQLFQSLFGLYA